MGDVEDADAVMDMGMDVSVDVVNQVRPEQLCESVNFAISKLCQCGLCWQGSSGSGQASEQRLCHDGYCW